MSTKDLIVEAKNLILTSGWTQGEYGDGEAGYCIMGALQHNATDYSSLKAARDAVKLTLRNSGRITDIVAWNDADHRTEAEVLNLLDEAASNA